jgi:hypothetical protein
VIVISPPEVFEIELPHSFGVPVCFCFHPVLVITPLGQWRVGPSAFIATVAEPDDAANEEGCRRADHED